MHTLPLIQQLFIWRALVMGYLLFCYFLFTNEPVYHDDEFGGK
jgi:hypothetical protein